jgi:hypothetical protein
MPQLYGENSDREAVLIEDHEKYVERYAFSVLSGLLKPHAFSGTGIPSSA